MPECYHHVYTVRTSSPTRLRCRPMAPNFDQKLRRRPPPQEDELVVCISRSCSPSPTRRHPHLHEHHKQRLAVKIYKDRQGNPSPRLPPSRIPSRRYTSQTMQRLSQKQQQQQQHPCHCHIHRISRNSSPSRCVLKREESENEEEQVMLEDLVEAAFQACKRARQLKPRLPNAIGAALLCNNGDVFLACSLGKDSNYSSGSAERAILRKALREGHCPPFEALVLAIDASHNPAAFAVPDKECFRLFGFLPIFLVNKNLDIHSTTSSAAARPAALSSSAPLKPHPRVATQVITPSPSPPSSRNLSPRRTPCSRSPLRRSSVPSASSANGPNGWSCAQVLEWLVQVVRLPQYVDDFKHARVDGHTLFHIYNHEKATAGQASPQSKAYHRTHQYHAFSHSSSALENTLHVYQPTHKKRLLAEIQKLKYGGCVSVPPKKAAPCSVQTRKPEQPTRVVVTAEDNGKYEGKAEEDEYDEDDVSTLQRRERGIKAAAAAAAKAAAEEVVQKHDGALAHTKSPLKQLSRVKKAFDDCLDTTEVGFNKQTLLDGTEALIGLRTLGCTASQESVREYFTRRSIGLKRRDVSFYEFLRAVLTLGGVKGWANALPQTTTKATSIDTFKDEGLQSRSTTKNIKTGKVSTAPPSKVLPMPPQVSSSSHSSSSYSSSSSSSSCSPSQCSVSSLSGAEEEEEESVKRNRVPSLQFTPPSVPSRPPAPLVVPDTSTLFQPVKPPPMPHIAAVTATTPSLVTGPPRALAPPQLPTALPGMEFSNDSLAPPPDTSLPITSPKKRIALIPPLPTVAASHGPITTTMKPVQEEDIPVPANVGATVPAVCVIPPLQAPQTMQKEVESSSPLDSSQVVQILSHSVHRQNSSLSSCSKSSKSSYSPRSTVMQALRRPSPPSIDSLSTSSTVSSIEHEQQQQQPMPSSHEHKGSFIESILAGENISGLHGPPAPLSSNSLSSTTSSSSSSSSPTQPPPPAALLDMGTKIEARYQGRDRWFTGIVARTHQKEHSYDIHYDDGDEETHVPQELVRPRGASTALQLQRPSSVGSSSSVSSALSLVFQKGNRVEARYRGWGTFYSGVIEAVHASDGSYKIHYDDGDVEDRVAAALVRAVGGKS